MSSSINTQFSPSTIVGIGGVLSLTALACTKGKTAHVAKKCLAYGVGIPAFNISIAYGYAKHCPFKPGHYGHRF